MKVVWEVYRATLYVKMFINVFVVAEWSGDVLMG